MNREEKIIFGIVQFLDGQDRPLQKMIHHSLKRYVGRRRPRRPMLRRNFLKCRGSS